MKSQKTEFVRAGTIQKYLNKLSLTAAIIFSSIMPFQSAIAGYESKVYVNSSEYTGIRVTSPNVYWTFDKRCKNSPSFLTQANWTVSSTAGSYVTVDALSVRVKPKHASELADWLMSSGGTDRVGSPYLQYPAGISTVLNLPYMKYSYKWRVNSGGTYLVLNGDFNYDNNDVDYCRHILFLYELFRR